MDVEGTKVKTENNVKSEPYCNLREDDDTPERNDDDDTPERNDDDDTPERNDHDDTLERIDDTVEREDLLRSIGDFLAHLESVKEQEANGGKIDPDGNNPNTVVKNECNNDHDIKPVKDELSDHAERRKPNQNFDNDVPIHPNEMDYVDNDDMQLLTYDEMYNRSASVTFDNYEEVQKPPKERRPTIELEIDLLRQQRKLEELEEEKTKKRKHKKHKRRHSQDEGKKRNRSRTPEKKSKRRRHERDQSRSPRANTQSEKRKHFVQATSTQIPRIKIDLDDDELNGLSVRPSERTVKLINLDKLLPTSRSTPKITNTAPLSIKQKRNVAVERVKALLKSIKQTSANENDMEFLFVSTMCKLPGKKSAISQDSFQNPSPLCNNSNVQYKLNSTAGSRINMAKWGLQTLPTESSNLLRLIGMDVTRLKELQSSIRMSQKMLKMKKEAAANESANKAEDFCTSSALYANASTQTDDKIGKHLRHVSVQASLTLGHSEGVFWSDPNFDETFLAQSQSNVLYALKEICGKLPNARVSDRIFQMLRPILALNNSRDN